MYGRVVNTDRHSVDFSTYQPIKFRVKKYIHVYGKILADAFTITFGHHDLVTAIFLGPFLISLAE